MVGIKILTATHNYPNDASFVNICKSMVNSTNMSPQNTFISVLHIAYIEMPYEGINNL